MLTIVNLNDNYRLGVPVIDHLYKGLHRLSTNIVSISIRKFLHTTTAIDSGYSLYTYSVKLVDNW